MHHSPGFLKLVQDAKSRIEETDVATVKRRLDAGESLVLIDVREESEWGAGHIPGAIHLGRGILERDIEQLIPDHAQEIIVYCGGGFRSALAAENLKKMGYERPVSMDGGMSGWRAAGLSAEVD
jgi:rhodanese-related sulfurtransferase